jgi:hypothetical protein
LVKSVLALFHVFLKLAPPPGDWACPSLALIPIAREVFPGPMAYA